MHLRHAVLAVMVATTVLVGCKSQSTANSDKLAETQASLQKRLPGAKVGVVSATLPENGLVAVEQVDVTKYYVGDTLVFVDVDLKVIGAGTVVAKTDKALHVKYDVTEKGRAPQVGDVAVKPQE